MELTPDRTALIVVDMQNAFCKPSGSLAGMGIDIGPLAAVIEPCGRLVNAARATGVPVIFTRYVYRPDYRDGGVLVKHIMPGLAEANSLKAGTDDIEIVEELTPLPDEPVIDKNRPSAFYGTQLDSLLSGYDAQSVVVCGVTTNMCVETTIRDASQRDILPYMPKDATGEIDQLRYDGAVAAVEWLFGKVVTVDDVVEAWGQGKR